MRASSGLLAFFLYLICTPSVAQQHSENLKALLILKIAELEQHIAQKTNGITIHVMGAPELALILKKFEGNPLGQSKLTKVSKDENLPQKRVDILFVGSSNHLKKAIHYAQKLKVMTITDRVELFKKGLSVSILTEKRHPKIALNPRASTKAGLVWILDFSEFQSLTLEFKKASR